MSIFSTQECAEASYPIVGSIEFSQCWYNTGGHKTTQGGQGYVPAGQSKAGFMSDFNSLIFPTKYKDVLIEQSASYDRAWLRKGSALNAALIEDPEGNQPNYWQWNNPASLELKNEDGSPFYFHSNYLYAQATFSNNGRWMLLFDTTGYLIRIDLEELSISTYRVASEDASLWAAISISDSGRYIAVNDRISKFFVMDTEGCTESHNYIKVPTEMSTCTRRSLRDYADEFFEDLYRIWAEFHNENTLRLKGIGKDGSGDEIIVRAPNSFTRNYVALGDSFSSGEGAGSYIEGTNTKKVNMCHTSTNSYPYWIASHTKLDSFMSIACSGAIINNFWGITQYPLTSIKDRYFPGKLPQKDMLGNANVITLTMSGNDIGFGDKLSYCLKDSMNCYNSYEERIEIANQILEQQPRLVDLYKELLGKWPNKRKVYVVGYPQILNTDPSAKCAYNVQFTAYQRTMANDLISYFNAVIKSAAVEAGAFYVGSESSLDNYKLCSGLNQVVAVNGLTFGNEAGIDDIGPFSKASYHPNELGHRLLGQTILEKTDSLQAMMPRANSVQSLPDPSDYPFTQGLGSNGSLIHKLKYNEVTDNVLIKRGIPNLVKTSLSTLTWAPRTLIGAFIFSEPVKLGELTSDDSGELTGTITIPVDVSEGMHELRLNGIDENGQYVSVRQYVYVTEDQILGESTDGVSQTRDSSIQTSLQTDTNIRFLKLTESAQESVNLSNAEDTASPASAKTGGVSNPNYYWILLKFVLLVLSLLGVVLFALNKRKN